jgi:lysophospholipase L1-like esterase
MAMIMNSAGRVLKALTLSAVGLALAVAGAEGAFRLARLAAPGLFVGINTYADLQSQVGSYFRPETFIPFTLAPDYRGREMSQEYPGRFVSVNTNALGLRMHETTQDKPPGLRRVLTLGDSYTFGVYVENDETWPARLETELRARGVRDVEVINAGYADGFCPSEHYAWLVNRGLAFRPDVVVYGFFVGNDLDCAEAGGERWVERDTRGLPRMIANDSIRVDEHGRIRARVARTDTVGAEGIYRLPVLRDLYTAVIVYNGARVVARKLGLGARRAPASGGATAAGTTPPPPFPWVLQAASTPQMQRDETRLFRLVRGMRDVATEHGALFALVMIPTNFQVEPRFLEDRFLQRMLPPADYGPQRVRRDFFQEMKPMLDRDGILHVDLLRAMLARPGKYYPDNGEIHFNPRGNAFAAAVIADALAPILARPAAAVVR